MTIDQISKLAAQNIVPSEKLPLAEMLLWYRLRDIYKSFADKTISKERAAEQKQKAVKLYGEDSAAEKETERYMAYHAELWRSIEAAANAYTKEKTIENADKFMEAVYGVKMNEE